MNGLFYDIQNKQLIDFVGGFDSIRKNEIEAIGDPFKRFEEDHLRILRGYRFRSELGFRWSPQTFQATQVLKNLTFKVSGERIFGEMSRLLNGPHWLDVLVEMGDAGIWNEFFQKSVQIPLQRMMEDYQNRLSCGGVWEFLELRNELLVDEIFTEGKTKFWSLNDLETGNQRWLFLILTLRNCYCLTDLMVEKWMDQWRLPKDLRKTVNWVIQKISPHYEFSNFILIHESIESRGQFLEFMYQPLYVEAIQILVTLILSKSQQLQYLDLFRIKKHLGPQLPKALVAAADLPREIRGKEIGLLLKKSFYLQIFNEDLSKNEILNLTLQKINE